MKKCLDCADHGGVQKTRNCEDGLRIVDDFEQSGLSRREYCEQNSLPLTTLDYWPWKKAKVARPRLVPVAVHQPESSGGFSLALANGRRIESLWTFSEADLARRIRLVESA